MEVLILEDVLQASAGRVGRNNGNAPSLHGGPNEWNDVLMPKLPNLRRKETKEERRSSRDHQREKKQ